MEKTQNLNLSLPTGSTTSWGQSYNNNFKTLDQKYSGLISQMENLRKQMGSLGLYYVDDYYEPELIVSVTQESEYGISYYKVTEIKAAIKDSADYTISLMSDEDNEKFNTLFPYTMFMITTINNSKDLGKVRYYFGDTYEEWEVGDYIVKYNAFNETGTVGYWKRMPQTVGGYYLPAEEYVMNGNVPTLTYTKTPALAADANESVTRGALYTKAVSIANNGITFGLYSGDKAIKANWYKYSYPTLEESGLDSVYPVTISKPSYTFTFAESFMISDVQFFNSNTSPQTPVYIQYTINATNEKNSNGTITAYKRTITVDTSYLNPNETIYMQIKFAKQGQLGIQLE